MAFLEKLKKGGNARYVITEAVQNEVIRVPRGFQLQALTVETLSALTGTNKISVGSAPGVYCVQRVKITHAAAHAGHITLDGVAVELAGTETVEAVVLALAAASYTIATTTTAVAWVPTVGTTTDAGDTLVLTSAVPVALTTSIVFNDTDTTDVTATVSHVDGTVSHAIVDAAAVSNNPPNHPSGNVVALTIAAGAAVSALRTPSISFTLTSHTSTTVGTFVLNGRTYTPTTAGAGTVTADAATIVNAVNKLSKQTGLYAYSAAGFVIIGYQYSDYSASNANQALVYDFGVAGAKITGATLGTVTHVDGVTTSTGVGVVAPEQTDGLYYINFDTVASVGKVSVYANMQKMN